MFRIKLYPACALVRSLTLTKVPTAESAKPFPKAGTPVACVPNVDDISPNVPSLSSGISVTPTLAVLVC